MLSRIVGDRAVRYGVVVGEADIEELLRALWRRHHREPYPSDIPER
jgi:hypothetical protein